MIISMTSTYGILALYLTHLDIVATVNKVDPSGHIAISVTLLFIGAIVGAVLGVKIGKSGGYRVDDHYQNGHSPTHVHISGDDGTTRVDINGNPIQGDRPMTHGERKAFWNLIESIIKALKPWL